MERFKQPLQILTAAACIPFAVVGFVTRFIYASVMLGVNWAESFIDWVSD